MVGYEGEYYNDTLGVNWKPTKKLFEHIESPTSDTELEAIKYNTEMFDRIVNGSLNKYD